MTTDGDIMELEQIEILDRKVTQAVELIGTLRSEKDILTQELTELKSEAESRDSLIRQLKEENHNLKLVQQESSLGKEKEEQIRSKVEQMLNKLDELQAL